MSLLRIRPGFTANKITLTPTGPRPLKMIGSVSGGTGSSAIATKIVIATAPANAITGSTFGTQPIIQLRDSASVIDWYEFHLFGICVGYCGMEALI